MAGDVLDAQRAVEAEIDAVRSVKFDDAIVEMCERAPIGEVVARVARDPNFAEGVERICGWDVGVLVGE